MTGVVRVLVRLNRLVSFVPVLGRRTGNLLEPLEAAGRQPLDPRRGRRVLVTTSAPFQSGLVICNSSEENFCKYSGREGTVDKRTRQAARCFS